ncbi:MAG: hypothetical protein ACR2OE_16080 [Thermomicrobiales bacterium]
MPGRGQVMTVLRDTAVSLLHRQGFARSPPGFALVVGPLLTGE